MNKTALIFICTGRDYHKFIQPAITSARFLPSDILLFTDSPQRFGVTKQVQIPHVGWPHVTLMRYHTMLNQREWLSQYEYIFYMDICMNMTAPIGTEILSDGITACIHASFIMSGGQYCTPEEDPRSTAYLSKKDIRKMYIGGFQGGKTQAFLSMAEIISKRIDIDNANDFIATWHDESHLNRYLYEFPPTVELGLDYNTWSRTPATKIWRVPKGTPNRPAINGKQPYEQRNLPS